MERLERNLTLYRWYLVANSALFWQPVFILWFSLHLGPAAVLRLEAVYYVTVVLLEVPSGWLSDRVGRRPLLVASSAAWAMGSVVLAQSTGFVGLACGQVLFAAGMALASGTDSALHYDTLAALGRAHEIASREGRARAGSLGMLALSGLVGGAAGAYDLRLAYALSAVAAIVAMGLALGMAEPPHAPEDKVGSLRTPLGDPTVRWVLAYTVVGVCLVHVPYEFGQPWLDALTGGEHTALLAGVVTTGSLLLGAAASLLAPRLADLVGPALALHGAMLLQVAVVGGLAAAVHPALLLLMLGKNIGWALANPLLAAMVHPRLPSDVRATWLSVQSLLARLVFAMALWLTSVSMGDGPWTAARVQDAMAPFVLFGLLAALGLGWARPKN